MTDMDTSRWNGEFAARYARHADELKWLYCELYHGDMRAYEYFVGMLHRAYEERPEDLRRLDRAREGTDLSHKGKELDGSGLFHACRSVRHE